MSQDDPCHPDRRSVGRVTTAETQRLWGRDREIGELATLIARAREGHSGSVVVSGEAGVGKTALVDHVASAAGQQMTVKRIVAAESEMELAYAGLQLLCGPMMDSADTLPTPQRDALESALGMRVASAPSPFLVGLAVLGLLTEAADGHGLLCIVDDAHWLDQASVQAITFVARRLEAEGIVLVLVMRTVDEQFVGFDQLTLEGLADVEALKIFRRSVPVLIDPRVRDQLITEARGNPLALQELPRALSPAELAGGFALTNSLPLQDRIEESLRAQLDHLPESTWRFLLLAAADPTGDPGLLRRASTALGFSTDEFDRAERAQALVVGNRVGFRHPLVRSAIYRAASPPERRRVHGALADATDIDRDPDRRAWHRAHATSQPDEGVASDLERSAARARERGGAAAAAAFLERAAELTLADDVRVDRLIAAAEAKHDAGAFEAATRLVDSARGYPLTELQEALIARLRARAAYAIRRDQDGPQQLLAAARGLEGLDPVLARDTYIDALAAALYGGRLGDSEQVSTVANAVLEATAADHSNQARDLLLRGQALLAADGQEAAIPTLRRALHAFLDNPPDALELQWMWLASRAAQDLWDAEAMQVLADRQVELARAAGMVSVLPIALSLLMVAQTLGGDLEAADSSCNEIDTLRSAMGHPVPQYGRMFLAAYRGQADLTRALARQVREDGRARGEGYALSAANFAESILYNGLGRYPEALAAARRELPYTHELNHAMRALLELVEAATRTGEVALAEEGFEKLASVTTPIGNDWALGVRAMAQAQLHNGEEADGLYREALDRFERERIPIMIGRTHLLYGEMLRRQQRRVDAREHLRSAYEILASSGLSGFAARAARELSATGETVRVRTVESINQLTDQELNVARLARDGLTNRDIGARLFISSRTAEYHLHKVFMKLGLTSRSELGAALAEMD